MGSGREDRDIKNQRGKWNRFREGGKQRSWDEERPEGKRAKQPRDNKILRIRSLEDLEDSEEFEEDEYEAI